MSANDLKLAYLRSSELAQALFNEAGDGLLIVDPASGQVLEVNPPLLRLTRLRPAALLGQPVTELIRHEEGQSDWLEAARVTRAYHGHDGFLLATDHPEVWLPISLSVSRLHAGEEA